jgi:phosphate transport system substrate-binding protein
MPNFLTDPYWIVGTLAMLGGILAGVIPLLQLLQSNRPHKKDLTYKILSDEALVDPAAQSTVAVFLDNGNPVPDANDRIRDANLLVLSVKNTGSEPITGGDYIPPRQTINFIFEGQEVIDVTHVRTEPTLGLLAKGDVSSSGRGPIPGQVWFNAGPTLNQGASIFLNILTRGKTQHISHQGDLIGGRIKPYQRPRPIRREVAISATGGLVIMITLLLLLLHVFSSYSSSPPNPICASGSLTTGGSTALLPLVDATASAYQEICPHATISTKTDTASSQAGLSALEAGTIQIGDSDFRSSKLNLTDHPVAAVTYVMVIHNQSIPHVTDLTMAQIQGIYDGSIKYWDDGGIGSSSHTPIIVVNRTTTSGSRATFENYVLGKDATSHVLHPPMDVEEDTSKLMAQKVATTPGAIGYVDQRDAATTTNLRPLTIDGVTASPDKVKDNSYKFWTIEHMYTQGNPSELATAFLQYITSKNNNSLVNNLGYIPFYDMPAETVNDHPSPLAPDGL